jgi:hypothetical protein
LFPITVYQQINTEAESSVQYLGIEVDDAINIAGQVEL